MPSHIFIPDTQIREGVDTSHIAACGRMIVDKKPDCVIVVGDWWDFPSLSSHNSVSKISYNHVSYIKDFQAGIKGMETLLKPLEDYNKQRRNNKKSVYKPRLIFTMGNHEYRRDRLLEQQTILLGALPDPFDYLTDKGFEVYPYKQRVVVDGISYCHLCPQTKSAGAVERAHLIMQKRNRSWTVGHSQMLDYFVSPHDPRLQCIIAGAFYTHDEGYKEGSNDHWRGLVYKTNVKDGSYDPEFISIDGLMKKYGESYEC